jgi:hypothetical protein
LDTGEIPYVKPWRDRHGKIRWRFRRCNRMGICPSWRTGHAAFQAAIGGLPAPVKARGGKAIRPRRTHDRYARRGVIDTVPPCASMVAPMVSAAGRTQIYETPTKSSNPYRSVKLAAIVRFIDYLVIIW